MIRNFKLLGQIVITKSHLFDFEQDEKIQKAQSHFLTDDESYRFFLYEYGLYEKSRTKNPKFSKITVI